MSSSAGFHSLGQVLETIAGALLIICLAYLTGVRVRVRRPRPHPLPVKRWFATLIGTLGISIIGSTPAVAAGPSPISPRRSAAATALPWSPAGGPPPHPPAGPGGSPPWVDRSDREQRDVPNLDDAQAPAPKAIAPGAPKDASAESIVESRTRRDPSGGPDRREDRLAPGDEDVDCAERRACMAAHPSGRALVHTVKPGECLWTIAESIVGTDPTAVARYWVRIHKLNRQVIGPDPHLVYPGQRLQLPAADASD